MSKRSRPCGPFLPHPLLSKVAEILGFEETCAALRPLNAYCAGVQYKFNYLMIVDHVPFMRLFKKVCENASLKNLLLRDFPTPSEFRKLFLYFTQLRGVGLLDANNVDFSVCRQLNYLAAETGISPHPLPQALRCLHVWTAADWALHTAPNLIEVKTTTHTTQALETLLDTAHRLKQLDITDFTMQTKDVDDSVTNADGLQIYEQYPPHVRFHLSCTESGHLNKILNEPHLWNCVQKLDLWLTTSYKELSKFSKLCHLPNLEVLGLNVSVGKTDSSWDIESPEGWPSLNFVLLKVNTPIQLLNMFCKASKLEVLSFKSFFLNSRYARLVRPLPSVRELYIVESYETHLLQLTLPNLRICGLYSHRIPIVNFPSTVREVSLKFLKWDECLKSFLSRHTFLTSLGLYYNSEPDIRDCIPPDCSVHVRVPRLSRMQQDSEQVSYIKITASDMEGRYEGVGKMKYSLSSPFLNNFSDVIIKSENKEIW